VVGEQVVMGFGQGMSLRSLSVWLKGLGLPRASAPTWAAVIQEKTEELRERGSGRECPTSLPKKILAHIRGGE
jgi:hypothetical protein